LLASEDHIIYDATFRKSTELPHGDPVGYVNVLDRCEALRVGCELEPFSGQPEKELIPLVFAVRAAIPEFEDAVKKVVAAANAAAALFDGDLVIYFRPGDATKTPYRMIEKALTKGPPQATPDYSQILDIFGGIIECRTFQAMAAVLDTLLEWHNTSKLRICRAKDRWATPSSGGWRDLMINVVVGERKAVFEIQVVLTAMYKARRNLDAHAAYSEFRCIAEVLGPLGISVEAGSDDVSPNVGASARCSSGTIDTVAPPRRRSNVAPPPVVAKAYARLTAEVAQMRAEMAALKGQNAQLKAENAQLQVFRQRCSVAL
jgi:hypothetical protein